MSRAAKIGAKYTLILGQKEALEGTIIIRDMESGKQEIVKLEKTVSEIKKRLKK
jgi:histidyl-tRNA synthetase